MVARFPTGSVKIIAPPENMKITVPVIAFCGNAQLLDLALNRLEGLSSRGEEDELRLGEFVQVFDRLGLREIVQRFVDTQG